MTEQTPARVCRRRPIPPWPRANPPPDVHRDPGLPMPPKTLVGKPPVPPVELGSFGAGACADSRSERRFQGNRAGFHTLRWVHFALARCCGAMRLSENIRAQECLMTEHVTCSGKARLVRQRGLDVIACVWVARPDVHRDGGTIAFGPVFFQKSWEIASPSPKEMGHPIHNPRCRVNTGFTGQVRRPGVTGPPATPPMIRRCPNAMPDHSREFRRTVPCRMARLERNGPYSSHRASPWK